MWVIGVYHQVSLFSLKPSDATSTGGRSLLLPTPFSIKMALLDVALRLYGLNHGSVYFPAIRDVPIAASAPHQIMVNNCFMRILKPRRNKAEAEDAEAETSDDGNDLQGGPFIRTVSFREYVQYGGPLALAIQVADSNLMKIIVELLPRVTYFGKRGSLFQIDGPPQCREALPAAHGYIHLDQEVMAGTPLGSDAVVQLMDDCTPKLSFEQANIYSGRDIKLHRDRVVRNVLLPYRLARASRGFSLYERVVA